MWSMPRAGPVQQPCSADVPLGGPVHGSTNAGKSSAGVEPAKIAPRQACDVAPPPETPPTPESEHTGASDGGVVKAFPQDVIAELVLFTRERQRSRDRDLMLTPIQRFGLPALQAVWAVVVVVLGAFFDGDMDAMSTWLAVLSVAVPGFASLMMLKKESQPV